MKKTITLDFTNGKRPEKNEGEQYILTVEFHNGKRFNFSGDTKKEATEKFKSKYGSFHAIVKIEWSIE